MPLKRAIAGVAITTNLGLCWMTDHRWTKRRVSTAITKFVRHLSAPFCHLTRLQYEAYVTRSIKEFKDWRLSTNEQCAINLVWYEWPRQRDSERSDQLGISVNQGYFGTQFERTKGCPISFSSHSVICRVLISSTVIVAKDCTSTFNLVESSLK